MYRALYRKWRPETFVDVVGQDAITTALSNQIVADKIGHAYLFTGTRGTGKTTCAKILAKAVNCENRDGASPCGNCVPCKGIENASILDVVEIDAASNNSVDDVRSLRDETAYRPSRCRFKVYIIDEVHMLSTSAFNALLKIMEEPPSHVIFILATTEIHKVPATILSRCQRYDFLHISPEHIAARLLYIAGQEDITLTGGAADLIARLADGAMRDALSLLDTCSGIDSAVDEVLVRRMAGVADKEYLFSISEAVGAQDISKLLVLMGAQREKSIDVKRLTEELVYHYRNLMLAQASKNGELLSSLSEEDKARYLRSSAEVGESFALLALRRLVGAMDKMGRSASPWLELEIALFDLADARPASPALPLPSKAAPVGTVPAPSPKAPASLDDTSSPLPEAPAPSSFAPQSVPAVSVPSDQPLQKPPEAPMPESPPPEDEPPFAMDDEKKQPRNSEVEVLQETQPEAHPDAAPPPVDEPETPDEQTLPPVAAQQVPDGQVAFDAWPEVVARMADVDRMLHSFMKKSAAYLEGRRVLIDGGDMFLSYMREYEEAGERIKTIIQDVTGARYAIGPYIAPEGAPKKEITSQDVLSEWQQKGVQIEYE